jgi:anaerobic selenocysteine-containing dehydrogenase
VEQHRIGISTLLALHDLWGITGNVDVPGGNIINIPSRSHQVPSLAWGTEDVSSEIRKKTIGTDEYPLMMTRLPRASPDLLIEAIFTRRPYPLKMAWLQSTNPIACMAAEPQKVYQAMRKMDFLVVVDLFMTPSAMAFADLVLPAASALERDSLRADTFGTAWWGPLRAINKVIRTGNCKSDEEIILDVGKRLNPKAFPWENVEEMLDYLLADTGTSFAELRDQGLPSYSHFEYRKFEKGLLRPDGKPGFDTLTGKFMLYLPSFEELGLDPLPFFEEPPESPIGLPELAVKYPLILTTGARSWAFFHSEHRQIGELREIHSDPLVEIHPDNACRVGIKEGDWVWIENAHGRCRQRAKLTETIDPRVVSAQHGWWFPEKSGPEPSLFGVWESNINMLIPLGQVGPSGWCAPYKSSICKIYKSEEKQDV